jgi:hypothetical protein
MLTGIWYSSWIYTSVVFMKWMTYQFGTKLETLCNLFHLL